jgi:hypothetical protein
VDPSGLGSKPCTDKGPDISSLPDMKIKFDVPKPEKGQRHWGTKVTVNGVKVYDDRPGGRYPNEGAMRLQSITLVENHVMKFDVLITHTYVFEPKVEIKIKDNQLR